VHKKHDEKNTMKTLENTGHNLTITWLANINTTIETNRLKSVLKNPLLAGSAVKSPSPLPVEEGGFSLA
jgi:hypothetical protein